MQKNGNETNQLRARLQAVLDEAMTVDGPVRGKICVLNPATGVLEIQVQRGFSERFLESFREIEPDDPLASAWAFRLGHRVTIPDVIRDPRSEPLRDIAREEGYRAVQATPIIDSKGRVIGALSTHFERVHAPSSLASRVLDHCATKAALVIEDFLG